MAPASPSWGSDAFTWELIEERVSLPSFRSFLCMGSEQLPCTSSFLLGRLLSPAIVRSQEPVTLSALSQERLRATVVSPEMDKQAGRAPVPDMGATELG